MEQKISITNNLFIHAAFSGYNNINSCSSIEKIITFFIENNLHKQYDINEKIFLTTNKNNIQEKVGLFYLLFKAGYKNYSHNFLQKLLEINLQFDPFSYVNEEKYSNVLFSSGYFSKDKTIFVMNNFIKQYGKQVFVESIKKANILQDAIQSNYYDMIEFLLNYLDINTKNNLGETAFFYANNLKMIEFLNQYKPNWSIKNNLNQDCLFSFIKLGKEGNLMVKYISNLKNQNKNQNQKEEVQNIYNILFHMIDQKQNKQSIEDFMKKYPNIDFSQAENENKTSIINYIIQKKSLLILNLFKNIDLYKKNEHNSNIFLELMNLNYSYLSETKQKQFSNLLIRLLEQPEKNMDFLSYQQFLENFTFNNEITINNLIALKTQNLSFLKEILKIFEQKDNFSDQLFPELKHKTKQSMIVKISLLEPLIQKYDIPNIDSLYYKVINNFSLYHIETQLLFLDQFINKLDEIKGTNFKEQRWNSINHILEQIYISNNKSEIDKSYQIYYLVDYLFQKNKSIDDNPELKHFIHVLDLENKKLLQNNFPRLLTDSPYSYKIKDITPIFNYMNKLELEKELTKKSNIKLNHKI